MPQPALDTHAEVRKLKQAGCPEKQAEAMVDLVSRAPLNAQIAGSVERVHFRLDSIESRMGDMATQSALEALTLRLDSIESGMADMATRKDLEVLRARTDAGIAGLRAEMSRMFWIQGGALATLILGLATIMLGLAL